MAKQLFAHSVSKGYTIKIYADTDEISYMPFEFETASWSVTYDAQDAYLPGIVSSRMELNALLHTFPSSASLENVLKDSEGIFYLELFQGLSKEWAGVVTPSVGTVEVTNGARVITIIAGDGFYKLDQSTSMYTYSGYKSFIIQIADMFNRMGFFNLFDGFAVSDTTRRSADTLVKTFDGLYHTGAYHELFYTDESKNYRTYREVLSDICVIFGLRMYQDKGFIVFQDFTRINDSVYSLYNIFGAFQVRRGFTSTKTLPVQAGGTKMYLPAISQLDITHAFGNTNFAFRADLAFAEHDEYIGTSNFGPEYIKKPGIPLGLYAGDGTTHFDFFATLMQATAQFPANYDSAYEVEFRLYFEYGTKSTNATIWGDNLFMAFRDSGRITSEFPGLITVASGTLNNYHIPVTPALGSNSVWIYLDLVQISGDPLFLSKPKIKYDIRLHGTGQTQTTYRADNTARVLGEKVSLTTRVGDMPKGTPILQAIMATTITVSDFVDSAGGVTQPLLWITANRLAQQRGQPQEYYEIDLHGTTRFTHYGFWGTFYYVPISLTYTWDTSRVTYALFFTTPLKSSPLLTRSPNLEIG
jgi:hypothetical protein